MSVICFQQKVRLYALDIKLNKLHVCTIVIFSPSLQAIVVTKYMFQFSFFPWNDESIHESPFWPPRIIGIEKNNNYASADLVLLLAMFIHRSILKVWKLALPV